MDLLVILGTISAILVGFFSIVIVLLVFLQNPKDQSRGSVLGTDVQQMIGVAHTSNVLEKITYGLAGTIFALTLLVSFSIHQQADKKVEDSALVTQLEKYTKQKSSGKK